MEELFVQGSQHLDMLDCQDFLFSKLLLLLLKQLTMGLCQPRKSYHLPLLCMYSQSRTEIKRMFGNFLNGMKCTERMFVHMIPVKT